MILALVHVGRYSFSSDKGEASLRKWLIICALVLIAMGASFAAAGYRLLRTIPVGGMGGWDYLTVDEPGRRLLSRMRRKLKSSTLYRKVSAGKFPIRPEFTVLHSRLTKDEDSSVTARLPRLRFLISRHSPRFRRCPPGKSPMPLFTTRPRIEYSR
jgi:hypothetical protein